MIRSSPIFLLPNHSTLSHTKQCQGSHPLSREGCTATRRIYLWVGLQSHCYDALTDIQNNLAIDDRPASNGTDQAPPPVASGPSRSENVPPPQRKFGPSLQHQLKSKEEEQQRLRGGARPRGSPQTLDIFADPPPTAPRPRRNSDSSLADKNKLVSSDEERKRRERRHREREARHRDRDGKPRPPGAKKPSRRLDVIDQLDLTGIYGTGRKYNIWARFWLSLGISISNVFSKWSTMMGPLTHATLTETVKVPNERL